MLLTVKYLVPQYQFRLRTKRAHTLNTSDPFLLHNTEVVFFLKNYYFLYIPISAPPLLPGPLMQILHSSLPSEKGEPPLRISTSQPPTHQITKGPGAASPSDARHGGPVRGMGSTCRQAADLGTAPGSVVGGPA